MSNKKNFFPIVSLVLLTLAVGPAHAAIKCWTNKQGVRECGNSIPPEYAQKQVKTLSDRGITTDVRERAKTQQELAEEQRRRQEEEKRLAEEKRAREQQAIRDRMLLQTFNSEEDIIRVRDRMLSAIDGYIDLTRGSIAKLEQQLEQDKKRAETAQSNNKPVSADLQQDIDTTQKQIENKNAYIAARQEEQETIRKKYEADLARFRELMQQRGR